MSNYNEHTRRVFFVFLDIENAPVRATTAGQDLYWDQDLGGERFAWLGVGGLGSISGLGANTQMSVESVELTMPLTQSERLKELDDNAYLGRVAQVYQIDLDAQYQVEKVVTRFKGHMDSAMIRRGLNPAITMTCLNGHATWNRRSYDRINHEQQQDKYPGDMGLEYVSSLVSAVLQP